MRLITGDDHETCLAALKGMRRPYHDGYLAMYSGVLDAIITDPVLMCLPMDDHLVHRGDGVFEAFKCIDGCIYNLGAHLERLQASAAAIELDLPCSLDKIVEIVRQTARTAAAADCMIRLFVSRGCGGFGVDPRECPRSNLYVIVTTLSRPFMEKHGRGATVCTSRFEAKPPGMASVKSCNYLINALMQKEAGDGGFDYAVSFDSNGMLAESSSANMGLVSGDGYLLFPRQDAVLRGTTMLRVAQLAEAMVKAGTLRGVSFRDIPQAEVPNASELLLVGTSINVLAVLAFDGKPVGKGVPGPVSIELGRLLESDMHTHTGLLTPVAEQGGAVADG